MHLPPPHLKAIYRLVKITFGIFLFIFSINLKAQTKPNIVVILVDDAGYADFGFMGSPDMVTPNIDAIASNGVYFTDAHTTGSACSPSRAGLLTGRYQQRFGHEQNTIGSNDGMDPTETTLADVLKTAGYTTAAFGKWHVGYKPEHHPNVRGFDEFRGFISGSRSYWPNASQDQPGKSTATQHNGVYETFSGYYTDVLGDQAISFIDANKENPFFIYLAYNAIHTPLEARSDDLALFSSISNTNRRKAVAMNYALDRSVGNVIAKLEAENILDNTLIFFLSDNGGPQGSTYDNGVLKSDKGYEFEGGHRVSFAMQWNDKIPTGTVFNGLSSALDIFPTSMKAAGIDNTIGKPLDGVDLMPFLDNDPSNDNVDPHDMLFWRISPWEAARIGDYKMVRASSAATAVYDIANDLSEVNNIKDANPNEFNTLASEMDNWASEMAEQMWAGSASFQDSKFYNYEDLVNNRPFRTSSMSVNQIVAQNQGINHYDDVISRHDWQVIYVDGETTGNEGNKVIDGDYRTYWDSGTSGASTHPHEIQIDLGSNYDVEGLRYSPRNDGFFTGSIIDYEIYVSNDINDWGAPVIVGTWNYGTSDRDAVFSTKEGRYIRFVSKSSKKGNNAIITELNVIATPLFNNCDIFDYYTEDTPQVFAQNDFIPYTTNQDQPSEGSFTVSNDGSTLDIIGNRWIRTQNTYTITANTILEFEYKSTQNGEIHAIGFDEDNSQSSNRVFGVYGTDSFGIPVNDFYSEEGEYQFYSIPVGEYYTGINMNLVFVNDNDISNPQNTSSYKNIKIYENTVRAPLIVEGLFKIAEKETGKLLGVNGNAPNTTITLETDNNSDAQKWYFRHINNSYYTLRNNATNTYLDIIDDNGTLKIIDDADVSKCSAGWGVEDAENGDYKLESKLFNVVLEKSMNDMPTSGEDSNTISQKWVLTPTTPSLSIAEIQEIESQTIVLNPIKNGTKPVVIFKKALSNVSVSIYTLGGKKIHHQFYNSQSREVEIDKKLTASGMYIIEFSSDKAHFYKKIIVN
ncbi:sulfatase-like hydrolase/transferase [uncultured Algibacter sp.]|uniref:sulfatase-like hydrolase/transferase n=1 Tax=uncultured Algibacter sp. TaxID=298659 RepID=UPI00261611DB|nr:sulfatase-like hydrolase/transferase [uncultured Algibacter sp.]